MTRVLVLAGGQSDEHEVSISSASSLLRSLQGTDVDATALVITRDGRWLNPAESEKALGDGKAQTGGELTLHSAKITEQFDVVFPLIHGPHGEDGTLQGMLELAGLPYVGSGVLGSALCMDKVASKAVLKAHNIPQVRSELVTRHMYDRDPKAVLAAAAALHSPWFVKPANLGSSVGITRATTTEELRAGIELALKYDRRVIVEEGVVGARELEIGILGNDAPEASVVGEITYSAEWYDYETKYTPGRADLHIPADISPEVAARLRELALKAYLLLDCAGLARVDFFYQPRSDELLLNEVNTMPGFTPTSMFTKLWEHTGLPYAEIVKRFIALALERHSHT